MESTEKEKERLDLPIFPNIICSREKNTLKMESYLRKKHRGKYYLWHFERNAYVKEGINNYSAALSSFTRDIYLAQHYGKIDPKATYRDGTHIFPLSHNQHQTEKERIDPNRFNTPPEPTEN